MVEEAAPAWTAGRPDARGWRKEGDRIDVRPRRLSRNLRGELDGAGFFHFFPA